jgi:molecular chaperone HtpG
MFNGLTENEDAYKKFHSSFAKNIKLGIHEDSTNRAKLAVAASYSTSTSGDEMTSLEDYVSCMDDSSPEYVTGVTKQTSHLLPSATYTVVIHQSH